ncbi:MAG: PUR family DNA/RNA-binding protein [Nitrospirae bacterium]|nr:PUR family DNA/RNA-binding protein [Nitrospirota bacterium]
MSTQKKELFSETVKAGSRTYFFDVKESASGSKYLVINESRKVGESHEHKRVMAFEEDVQSFSEGLKKAVEFMGK